MSGKQPGGKPPTRLAISQTNNRCSLHVGLLGELDVELSLLGSHHVLVLDSHDTTTPDSSKSLVVIELSLELLGESVEVGKVFLSDVGDGNAGSGLHVAELSEVSLASDEAEGDTLLSAEGW